VVLLDEPFASLDPSLRDDVRTDVIAALRRRNAAAVLITHDREEALALGDRVAVMSNGQLLQIGRPDELFDRPSDRFVATFLGEASFLPDPDSPRARDDGATARPEPHHRWRQRRHYGTAIPWRRLALHGSALRRIRRRR